MEVIRTNRHLEVYPNISPYSETLEAIQCWRDVDELVTFALRKHGYGNDGYIVSYWSDEDNYNNPPIPNGYIELCCVGCGDTTGPLIREKEYIQLLSEVCKAEALKERGQLLLKTLKNPSLLEVLVEADPVKCNKRWLMFIPFLEKKGWKRKNEIIRHPSGVEYFHFVERTDDLDVLYRNTKKVLKQHSQAKEEWRVCHQTIVDALDCFFEYEDDYNLNTVLMNY